MNRAIGGVFYHSVHASHEKRCLDERDGQREYHAVLKCSIGSKTSDDLLALVESKQGDSFSHISRFNDVKPDIPGIEAWNLIEHRCGAPVGGRKAMVARTNPMIVLLPVGYVLGENVIKLVPVILRRDGPSTVVKGEQSANLPWVSNTIVVGTEGEALDGIPPIPCLHEHPHRII